MTSGFAKRLCIVLLCMAALAASAMQISFSAHGNAAIEKVGEGIFRFTAQPGEGWPQMHFSVPVLAWKDGTVSLKIRQVEPNGPFPGGLVIGTLNPKDAIQGGYITDRLVPGEAVELSFPCLGEVAPDFLQVSVKNPTAQVVLEISGIEFRNPHGERVKKRLAPIPPVVFKGKPFFPLGAYDTFKVGEGGQYTSMDERFLEAGGNFANFGALYLPPEHTADIFKKAYQDHGQPAIFAALDKIKDDPAWSNVALLVALGVNLMLDESEAKEVGMNSMLKPAAGEALELRKTVLAEAAGKLAGYPNVIGYTMDEPENCVWKYYSANFSEEWKKERDKDLATRMVGWLSWTKDVIRQSHPSAQMMPIIAWWTNYESTAPMYDVLIANTYPSRDDLFTVNYDAALQVAGVRAAGGGRSAIFMPPMYDIIGPDHIPFTIKEQLYVVFAPITRGAMGIHGWRLQRCSDEFRKFVVYPAMREVHLLKEYFLGEWCDELVSSDHDTASVDYLKKFQRRIRLVEGEEDGEMETVEDVVPDVSYCLRRHPDGSYLLLAVNNMRTPLKAKFLIDLPRLPRVIVDNINKSDKVWLGGVGKVELSFAPFGVHAYILRP